MTRFCLAGHSALQPLDAPGLLGHAGDPSGIHSEIPRKTFFGPKGGVSQNRKTTKTGVLAMTGSQSSL